MDPPGRYDNPDNPPHRPSMATMRANLARSRLRTDPFFRLQNYDGPPTYEELVNLRVNRREVEIDQYLELLQQAPPEIAKQILQNNRGGGLNQNQIDVGQEAAYQRRFSRGF